MPNLLDALNRTPNVMAAELRPPRAELEAAEGIDAWIDTYHAVRRLTREGTFVFLTDSAVGAREEDNIRHLVTNLGPDVSRERVVPFLTSKHPLDYCLGYAERARQYGFPTLVVLGGDRHVGTPRCVEHASELRQAIRDAAPDLLLGGWANPYADAAMQARLLADRQFSGEFFLTQIVSHHRLDPVRRFLRELDRQHAGLPGLFGVFFYRSANPRTLAMLSRFLPVPADELSREFEQTRDPVEVAARTVRAVLELGARHFYVSNLPLARAHETLGAVMERAGVTI